MDTRNRLAALARTFPGLAAKYSGRPVPGIEPFDYDRLLSWANGPEPGSGARWAALFILAVHRGRALPYLPDAADAKGNHRVAQEALAEVRECAFDVARAIGCWDDQHRQAFAAWAAAPWFV